MRRLLIAAATVSVAGALALPGVASAHTEAQYVAVPANAEITMNFSPTHGCSGSPTTEVAVRVPAPGATAGDVAGFTASAEPDGDRTVLRWTGGVLPADEEGEFPITFTVPDSVGTLLTFPTVQTCEVGEIAWIDGDPAGEYPAPRVLVLAEGSEPAHDIDEVPLDAPGRDQLSAIVDIDNPSSTTTPQTTAPEATDPATTTDPAPATTEVASATDAAAITTDAATTTVEEATTTPTTAAETTAPSTTEAPADDSGGSDTGVIIGVVIAVLVVAGIAGMLITRSRRS